MSLSAAVQIVGGRPVLTINGEPTTEFWCYGDPNAIRDFAAGGVRICQFHVPFPSWWTGHGTYNFEPTDRHIRAFLELVPDVLLIPRVNFGYVGEAWWAQQHPEQLAVGRNIRGETVDYEKIRARPVDCWFSAGSQMWTRDACTAMAAMVEHCESHFGKHILGYQIGGGISAEWFRWWNFVPETYEDYSHPARDAFRQFLRMRYETDAALQAAWGRSDVSFETAAVPAPPRLHEPMLGFFRDPVRERDVIDWLDCLSYSSSGQIMSLASAAKQACERRKLVGTFYGYFWPHWNTQSAARAGHMDLRRVVACPDIDFISSPYHYDNRHCNGFHHSQTVPQTIEHAGKLHVDEIDTFTHLADPVKSEGSAIDTPQDPASSCMMLRRDAATVLGLAGTGWWMDLHGDRWYNDECVQAEVKSLQALGRQSFTWPVEPHAEVALVVDDRSYACSHLASPLNQYFSSMGRQVEWSDLGFPIDTVMPHEIGTRRPYKVYVFLNCWALPGSTRADVLARTRVEGVTSVWFYGCGFYGGAACGEAGVSEITGIRVRFDARPVVPEIDVTPGAAPLVDLAGLSDDVPRRFGAKLTPQRARRCLTGPGHDWNTVTGPRFIVDDARATTLGVYAGTHEPGLAMLENDGWRSVYCGAPLLPGWLLRRIALQAGVHAYSDAGVQIFHRGPMLAAYKPFGGAATIRTPAGMSMWPLLPGKDGGEWHADTSASPRSAITEQFGVDETRYYWVESAHH